MSAQVLAALALAQETKAAQAAVIRRIREGGPETAAATLTVPDEAAGSIRLLRLLKAIPRYGERRIGRLLADAGIPQARLDRRLRELTDRERRVIATGLLDTAERLAA